MFPFVNGSFYNHRVGRDAHFAPRVSYQDGERRSDVGIAPYADIGRSIGVNGERGPSLRRRKCNK